MIGQIWIWTFLLDSPHLDLENRLQFRVERE
jgi:hypothetical protein